MTTLQNIIVSLIAGALGAFIVVGLTVPGAQLPAGLSRLGDTPTVTTNNEGLFGNALRGTDAHEQQVISAVESASPAVVSILISKDVAVVEQFFADPFDDFFGGSPFSFRVPQLRQRGTERVEVGGGSGFLVTADGLIITNRHVVADTDADYTVFLNDGTKYDARVIARDPSNDIAVLDIDAQNLPFLEFANSNDLKPGQTVIAIGNALSEFQNSVSVGVISGLSRSIIAGDARGATEALDEVIQTDAAINPGNSGGPLLNSAGQVVGVNVAVAQGSENIGFALPANLVANIIDGVKETGRIIRPFLGVRYTPVTPVLQEQNNLSVDHGVLIISGGTPDTPAVTPDSAAAQAGIREGDIILEIDGTRLDENTSLAQIIRRKNVGDQVTIKFLRDEAEQTVTATLSEAPQS